MQRGKDDKVQMLISISSKFEQMKEECNQEVLFRKESVQRGNDDEVQMSTSVSSKFEQMM